MKLKRVALATAMVATATPVGVLLLPAVGSAHTPNHDVSCAGVRAWTDNYNSDDDNRLQIAIDGVNVVDEEFDSAIDETAAVPQDGAVHTYRIKFDADPGNQYDHVYTGEVGPCGQTTTVPTLPPPVPGAEVTCVSTGPDYVSWQLTNTGEVAIVSPVALAPGESAVLDSLKNEQGTASVTVTFADESTGTFVGSGEGCVFVTTVPTTAPPTTPTTAPPTVPTTSVAPTVPSTTPVTDPPVTTPPATEAPTTTVVAPFDPEAELPATR